MNARSALCWDAAIPGISPLLTSSGSFVYPFAVQSPLSGCCYYQVSCCLGFALARIGSLRFSLGKLCQTRLFPEFPLPDIYQSDSNYY